MTAVDAEMGPALRVDLVIGSAGRGGAEGQLVRLAAELAARGVDVRVLFTAFGGPLVARLDAAGVPWRLLGRRGDSTGTARRGVVARAAGALLKLVMLCRLAAALTVRQPDVVFAWLPGAIWPAVLLATAGTRATRIAALRGDVTRADMRRFGPLLRAALRRADAVTMNAPALREVALRWGARPEQLVVIPNGVDLPPAIATVDQQPPAAAVVANFRACKGHEVLLAALARAEEPPEVRLMGTGGLREQVRTRAAELGLAGRVRFVEPPADVPAELLDAQFAIHPSLREGMPNAVLEALAAGLPVVATDVGGTGLLIEDGVNGFLVPAGDEVQLAKRIDELARSPRLRRAMAGAARRHAARFAWDSCVDSYLELFERTRRGRAARARVAGGSPTREHSTREHHAPVGGRR